MKQEKDFIEVPFGARDSELGGFEYTIPQGFEAEIKDGKVIVRKAESEDEKIRKWLIGYFNQYIIDGMPQVFGNGLNVKDVIAWFEKQGEQKPVECCADKLWTEFQKQVAYLMASSYNREYEYTKGYVEWVAQSLLGYAKNEIEQNHVEWSDDDEAFLDDILCKVESNLLLNKDEKNWLKSLKDRYTWKPSELQIEALAIAIRCGIKLGTWEEKALKDLIEHLKKLK